MMISNKRKWLLQAYFSVENYRVKKIFPHFRICAMRLIECTRVTKSPPEVTDNGHNTMRWSNIEQVLSQRVGLDGYFTENLCKYFNVSRYPANTIHRASVGLMLVHRLRLWPNIKPTLSQYLVLAGYCLGPGFEFTAQLENLPAPNCVRQAVSWELKIRAVRWWFVEKQLTHAIKIVVTSQRRIHIRPASKSFDHHWMKW